MVEMKLFGVERNGQGVRCGKSEVSSQTRRLESYRGRFVYFVHGFGVCLLVNTARLAGSSLSWFVRAPVTSQNQQTNGNATRAAFSFSLKGNGRVRRIGLSRGRSIDCRGDVAACNSRRAHAFVCDDALKPSGFCIVLRRRGTGQTAPVLECDCFLVCDSHLGIVILSSIFLGLRHEKGSWG